MSAGTMPDLQGLWETAQREVALEGSSGCTLKRLWELVELVDASGGGGSASQESNEKANREEGGEAADPDPREFLKGWLWRYALWMLYRRFELVGKFQTGICHALLVFVACLPRGAMAGCIPNPERFQIWCSAAFVDHTIFLTLIILNTTVV